MNRSTTETHIVTGKIFPSVQQKHIFENLFSDCCSACNCAVCLVHKQIEALESCDEYIVAQSQIQSLSKEIEQLEDKKKKTKNEEKKAIELELDKKKVQRKSAYAIKKVLIQAYGLTKYSLDPLLRNTKDKYSIPSDLFRGTILNRTASAIDAYFWANGENISFKKRKDFLTLQNASNISALRFYNNKLVYFKNNKPVFEIPVKFANDEYTQESLSRRVKYPILVRYKKKGEWCYEVQLAVEGPAPMKRNEYGKIRHTINSGRAGLDVGTQTIAFVTEDAVLLEELYPQDSYLEDEKRVASLQQKIDNCRRENNPNKYNENGTCKKKPEDKTPWVISKRQAKLEAEIEDICRKQAKRRKLSHRTLVNRLIGFADTVIVEDNDIKGWQEKKPREQDENGKEKSRKKFGHSVGHNAPGLFVSLLDQNLKTNNHPGVIKVKAKDLRPTQYNHTTDTYEKHDLSERVVYVNGRPYQRDLYSAYKLLYVNKAGTGYDKKALKENFAHFTELHDAEILRHKGMNNPKSMGIDILLAYLEMAQAA